MTVTTLNIPGFGPPAQGSHLTAARGGTVIHIAGQVGADENGTVAAGLAAQMERAALNVELALQAAGATVDDLVSMTIYVVGWDPSMIGELVQGATAARRGSRPINTAYTLIGVHSLFTPELLVELQAAAVVEA